MAEHEPKLFGFIDHDIFPLHAVSLTEKIGDAKTYGSRVDKVGAWYMWPGFCFFTGVPTAKLDFNLVPDSPHGFLDTGGASWATLYQHLSPADVRSVYMTHVDDREKAFVLNEVVDRDDVGMHERAHQPRLARKATPDLRVAGEVRVNDLERDFALPSTIVRAVHGAHATRADQAIHGVHTADQRPGRQNVADRDGRTIQHRRGFGACAATSACRRLGRRRVDAR